MKTRRTYLTLAFYLIFNAVSFAQHHDHEHANEGTHQEGSHSQDGEKNEQQTVTGEVVDLSCYLDHKAKGPGHKKCAIACAKKGLPIGILTKSNSLYLLIENHDNAKAYKEAIEHAAETVTVKGKVYNQGGVQAIRVSELKHHH